MNRHFRRKGQKAESKINVGGAPRRRKQVREQRRKNSKRLARGLNSSFQGPRRLKWEQGLLVFWWGETGRGSRAEKRGMIVEQDVRSRKGKKKTCSPGHPQKRIMPALCSKTRGLKEHGRKKGGCQKGWRPGKGKGLSQNGVWREKIQGIQYPCFGQEVVSAFLPTGRRKKKS